MTKTNFFGRKRRIWSHPVEVNFRIPHAYLSCKMLQNFVIPYSYLMCREMIFSKYLINFIYILYTINIKCFGIRTLSL